MRGRSSGTTRGPSTVETLPSRSRRRPRARSASARVPAAAESLTVIDRRACAAEASNRRAALTRVEGATYSDDRRAGEANEMTLTTSIVALALLQAAAPPSKSGTLNVTVVDEKGAAGLRPLARRRRGHGERRRARRLALRARHPPPRPRAGRRHQPAHGALLPPERGRARPAVPAAACRPDTQHTVWTTGDRPNQLVDCGDDVAAERPRAEARGSRRAATPCSTRWWRPRADLEGREGRRAVVVAVTGTGIGFADRDRRAGRRRRAADRRPVPRRPVRRIRTIPRSRPRVADR